MEYFYQLQNMRIKITPILGLNFGRIGFCRFNKKDLKVKIKNVIDGNYIIDKDFVIRNCTYKKFKSISLNDIILNIRGS